MHETPYRPRGLLNPRLSLYRARFESPVHRVRVLDGDVMSKLQLVADAGEKSLVCVYDNEPLPKPCATPVLARDRRHVETSCKDRMADSAMHDFGEETGVHGASWLSPARSARSTSSMIAQPRIAEIEWVFDLPTLQYLSMQLRAISANFGRDCSAAFIHRCLYEESMPEPMQDAYAICASYTSKYSSGEGLETILRI